jgi:ribosomal protein S18 acetylase RimI-like enzyme
MAHVDGLTALDHRCFHDREQRRKETIEAFCFLGTGFVALKNDVPVGMVLHFCEDGKNESVDNIIVAVVCVDEDYRRQGIAQTLLRMLIAAVDDLPIYLHVRASNQAAQNLYEKHGFKMVEILEDYYRCLIDGGEGKEHAIYMQRDPA